MRASETLREVFVDNATMLDMVDDDHIARFLRLIRTAGREQRFVQFLHALCVCGGKAVSGASSPHISHEAPTSLLESLQSSQLSPSLLDLLNLLSPISGAPQPVAHREDLFG